MASDQAVTDFNRAMREFLVSDWGRNCAGPWWEGGLQLDLGASLSRALGRSSIETAQPPRFLSSWPSPIMHERLLALGYRRQPQGALYSDQKRQRGTVPDFCFWPGGSAPHECWDIELKLWSVDGSEALNQQISGCIRSIESDAEKVLRVPSGPYAVLLLAVNVPSQFRECRRKHSYTPREFKTKLVERIFNSELLRQLATSGTDGTCRGDWCIAMKTINGLSVEALEIYSSIELLRLSPEL